jgi:hypothetical protein
MKDQFPEYGVCPGKPASGKDLRIIDMKRFMYKSGTGVGFLQCGKAIDNFLVIVAGKCLQNF